MSRIVLIGDNVGGDLAAALTKLNAPVVVLADAAGADLDVHGDTCELLVLEGRVAAAASDSAAAWVSARRHAAAAQAQRGIPLQVLLVPSGEGVSDLAWSLADMVICTAAQAADLCGADIADPLDAEDAAVRLCARGAGTAVVTVGADGAVVARAGRATYLPPFSVDVVDERGVDAVFCAAFAVAVLERFDMFAATGYAMAAAAVCATRTGSAEAMPTRDDVERMAHSVDLRRDPGTSPVQFPR